jgi:hypothetical protein
MDPLRFCIAVTPLAVYFLLIGLINLRGKPYLTTGSRDLATLGIAICGWVVIGPMELFFPVQAAIRFGPYIWLILLGFYGLIISLVVLLTRPRIVIYNMMPDELRPVLAETVSQLDKGARWSGESLLLPDLGVHLHLEATNWSRVVQLTSSGKRQNLDGWRKLELSLRDALKGMPSRFNYLGTIMLGLAAGLAIVTAAWMLNDREAVAKSLDDLLRR